MISILLQEDEFALLQESGSYILLSISDDFFFGTDY